MSVFHISSRQLVVNAAKQWLVFSIVSPQGEEAYLFLLYIYFALDEAMCPVGG